MRKLILASASPRRRELLGQAGYEFEVMVSEAEEHMTGTDPAHVVEELSMQKAQDVYRIYVEKNGNNISEPVTVIGADTVVAADGRILGKPSNKQEAYEMLKRLSGRTHEVYTGVTLVWNDGEQVRTRSFHSCTGVSFYPMTDEEIWSYIATGEPMDKAGSYGIQGGAAVYIRGIQGDYNNVVGLPIAQLYHELAALDDASAGGNG